MTRQRCAGAGGGGAQGVRQVAQEPPALRPRVTQAPDETRLRAMVQGLERLLANLPPGPLDAAPAGYEEAFAGSFLRDWRQLDSAGHRYEQARAPAVDMCDACFELAAKSNKNTIQKQIKSCTK